MSRYTATQTVNAYKSLSRPNDNNSTYTSTTKEEQTISGKNARTNYEALSSENTEKNAAPHYDGCYLELLQN